MTEAGGSGRLVDNVLMFVRTLRAAGLPVGPGQALDAVAALAAVGVSDRADVHAALAATLVKRREYYLLFEQAFEIIWRNPRLLERLATLALSDAAAPPPERAGSPLARRLADALASDNAGPMAREERPERERREVALSWSARERLGAKDFEQMSAAELTDARELLRRLGRGFGVKPLPTRRYRADRRGRRVDLRATLRHAMRGDLRLAHKARRHRTPALVLLCDVSGSMSRYARMLLHFAHALAGGRERVHTFVFGTRLTNVTRQLRARDVDQALDRVAEVVNDWDGSTRIGACLHRFNRDWSRRVLGQGAQVLLVSDGLDRDDPAALAREAERLQKSCRRLIWLNPLLRYDGFQPRAQGVRALLPYVDRFRAAHSINSLAELGALLDDDAPADDEVKRWQRLSRQ